MIEIIAVIFSLWSVYLAIKLNIWNWLVGIIGIVAYMVVFIENHLYAQTIVQIIFVGQSIYGWLYWKKNMGPTVVYMTANVWFDLLVVLGLTIILAIFLEQYTNDPQPFLDTLTTLLSILATLYMTKKYSVSWVIWCLVDILFVYMFLEQKMYWSAGLYILFTILAINGLIQWTKNTSTD